jgi:hypothetical protein
MPHCVAGQLACHSAVTHRKCCKTFVRSLRCLFRKSYASISHSVPAWQLGEILCQTGTGIAVRSTSLPLDPTGAPGANTMKLLSTEELS